MSDKPTPTPAATVTAEPIEKQLKILKVSLLETGPGSQAIVQGAIDALATLRAERDALQQDRDKWQRAWRKIFDEQGAAVKLGRLRQNLDELDEPERDDPDVFVPELIRRLYHGLKDRERDHVEAHQRAESAERRLAAVTEERDALKLRLNELYALAHPEDADAPVIRESKEPETR